MKRFRSLAALLAATLAACGGSEADLAAPDATGSTEQAAKGVVRPPVVTVSLTGTLAATAAFPTTTGKIKYSNAGGTITMRLDVTTSDVPVNTTVCDYANGTLIACLPVTSACGAPAPFTASFRLLGISTTNINGPIPASVLAVANLAAGSVIDVRLGTDPAAPIMASGVVK